MDSGITQSLGFTVDPDRVACAVGHTTSGIYNGFSMAVDSRCRACFRTSLNFFLRQFQCLLTLGFNIVQPLTFTPCFPLFMHNIFVPSTLVVTSRCTFCTNSAIILYSFYFWLIYQWNHINTFISYIGSYYCNIILKDLKYFSIFNYIIIEWTCSHQQYCWYDRNHSYGANHLLINVFLIWCSFIIYKIVHITYICKKK